MRTAAPLFCETNPFFAAAAVKRQDAGFGPADRAIEWLQ
jgi:hypothetical protein